MPWDEGSRAEVDVKLRLMAADRKVRKLTDTAFRAACMHGKVYCCLHNSEIHLCHTG